MKTMYEIRRARLRELVEKLNDQKTGRGGQTAIGKAVGKSRAYVNFWLTINPETGKYRKNMDDTSARAIEDALRPTHPWLTRGWLDQDPDIAPPGDPSQPAIPDIDRLGHALTSMDKVIRGRRLVMEEQLGKFRGLLAYAYALQDDASLFPSGINDATPKAERDKYDALVNKELGGMIENGTIEVARKAAPTSAKRAGPSKAKGKKTGSRRA